MVFYIFILLGKTYLLFLKPPSSGCEVTGFSTGSRDGQWHYFMSIYLGHGCACARVRMCNLRTPVCLVNGMVRAQKYGGTQSPNPGRQPRKSLKQSHSSKLDHQTRKIENKPKHMESGTMLLVTCRLLDLT